MITSVVLSLLIAVLTGTATASKGINPVQHSEGKSSEETTNFSTRPPNPVQHSE